ncbi:MAG: Fic/DOC family N-terminal domain-containing protein [Acidimicrobiales bacterium]
MPISGFDRRFGEEYEHCALTPYPLPEEIELSPRTWALSSEAMFSIGRLDQAGRQIRNPALLRRPRLRREAQSTSALEGTYAPPPRCSRSIPTICRAGHRNSSKSSTTCAPLRMRTSRSQTGR